MVGIVLLTIACGFLHGFTQGMIMIQHSDFASMSYYDGDGVRHHVLFKLYHFIYGAFLLSVVWVTLAIHNSSLRFLPIAGLLVLMWRFSEVAYDFARYARLAYDENVVLLDFYSFRVKGLNQVMWSVGWVIIGIWLLILG